MSEETVGVSAEFPTLEAAHAARDRLVRSGFARNSITIERDEEELVVSIPVRPENRRRAARILRGSAILETVRHRGGEAAGTLGGVPVLALAIAGLAGFALYGLANRR